MATVTFGAARRFAPDVGAVRAARRFAAEQLRGLGSEVDQATVSLVVSELATNAVLHARTPFTVTLRTPPRGGPGVRVEVQDSSSLAPTPANLGVAGMSGRGLTLVHAFASRWGVEQTTGGKVVWCELGTAAEAEEGEGLDAVESAAGTTPPGATSQVGAERLVTVVIPDLPVPALVAAKLQMEDLIRDLKVALFPSATAGRPGRATTPLGAAEVRVARQLDAAATAFSAGRLQLRSQALLAAGRGDAETTVELRLPPSAADAARRYRDALEEADALNRAGGLLVGAGLVEHDRLRRWYLSEIVAQLEAAEGG